MDRQVFVIGVLLLASSVLAQGPMAHGGPTLPPPEALDASKVPDPEKLSRTADGMTKMRAHLKSVLGKLEEARSSKDVVKLNCVNEKLTQIKGLLRISEQSDMQLQEAIARKEGVTATHEFTKLQIAQSKVSQLRAEAEDCIGQLAFRTDENLSVEVEVPDYLPSNDPTHVDNPVPIDSRPAAASGP